MLLTLALLGIWLGSVVLLTALAFPLVSPLILAIGLL